MMFYLLDFSFEIQQIFDGFILVVTRNPHKRKFCQFNNIISCYRTQKVFCKWFQCFVNRFVHFFLRRFTFDFLVDFVFNKNLLQTCKMPFFLKFVQFDLKFFFEQRNGVVGIASQDF